MGSMDQKRINQRIRSLNKEIKTRKRTTNKKET